MSACYVSKDWARNQDKTLRRLRIFRKIKSSTYQGPHAPGLRDFTPLPTYYLMTIWVTPPGSALRYPIMLALSSTSVAWLPHRSRILSLGTQRMERKSKIRIGKHHTPVRPVTTGYSSGVNPTALSMLSPHTHAEARTLVDSFRESRAERDWRSPRQIRERSMNHSRSSLFEISYL